MKSLAIRFAAVGIAAVVLAAGCSVPERPYPEKRRYVLDVSRASKPALEEADVVKVRNFQISTRFADKSLVYRTGEMEYESDFYNEFLSSPAAIITEETRQWLDASGLFANAVDDASRADARYLLEGNIVRLYGDYFTKQRQAVMQIQFFLIDRSQPRGQIVFHETYEEATNLDSNEPAQLVRALNISLQQILQSLEKDLRTRLFEREERAGTASQ